MNPFVIKEKVAPSFFESIFKVDPKFNAVIEINNLLASRPVRTVEPDHIHQIAKKYKLNIKRNYRDHFRNLYSLYLNHCFEDRKLSKNEVDDLHHLRKILYLTEKEILRINELIGERIYIEETKKALTDGRLTDEEKIFLEELKKNLSISEVTAAKIYSELAQDYFRNFFSEIISDNRISLEEERELEEIAESLGLDVNMDDKAKSTYNKMKMLWLIDNDRIPVVNVDFPCLAQEEFYFQTPCLLMEEAMRVKDYSPEPLFQKHKKGYSLPGSFSALKPEDTLRYLEKGTLLVSNKRMVFKSNKNIRDFGLERLIDLKFYMNGVEVRLEEEKQSVLFFNFQEHMEIFVALIPVLLKKLSKEDEAVH